MQTKALILDAEAINAIDVNKGESSGSEVVVRDSNKGPDQVNGVDSKPGLGAHDDAGGDAGGGSDNESLGGGGDSGSGRGLGSRGERIREKLERELKPVELHQPHLHQPRPQIYFQKVEVATIGQHFSGSKGIYKR
ncbi:hypothetical protein Drorol1_Dr00013500 [Drosera rotundifolia]